MSILKLVTPMVSRTVELDCCDATVCKMPRQDTSSGKEIDKMMFKMKMTRMHQAVSRLSAVLNERLP